MKVFAISDLHLSTSCNKPMDIFGGSWENYWQEIVKNWKETVTEDDIVLIAGDISWGMTLNEALPDLKEIEVLPGTKILTRGNHDYWWQGLTNIRKNLPEKMFVIQNDSLKIENYVFCGSRGWTVNDNGEMAVEDKVIYERELIRMELSLQSAKKLQKADDKLICMIHYPPFNSKFENSGFTALFEKYGVNKVIYGHLHGKNVRAVLSQTKNGIDYYLTSCDQVNNKLTEIY